MGILERLTMRKAALDNAGYYQEGTPEYEAAKKAGEERWKKNEAENKAAYDKEHGRTQPQAKPVEKPKPAVGKIQAKVAAPKQYKPKVVYRPAPMPPVDFGVINRNISIGNQNTNRGVFDVNENIARYNNNISNFNMSFGASQNNFENNLNAYEKKIRKMFG